MNKKILIPLLTLVIIGAVGFASTKAYANDNGYYPPIVQKIAERFGLNQDEVETVFDEARDERRAEMQNRFQERLNQAVSDGKITIEQKEAILAKKAEMQERHEELKDLSPEERAEYKEAHQGELKAWAEENGIDLKDLFIGMGMRGGHFKGMKGGFGFHK
ncbi:hypothetical protein ACFLZ1_04725 [Patescibacteria group bacterium]